MSKDDGRQYLLAANGGDDDNLSFSSSSSPSIGRMTNNEDNYSANISLRNNEVSVGGQLNFSPSPNKHNGSRNNAHRNSNEYTGW